MLERLSLVMGSSLRWLKMTGTGATRRQKKQRSRHRGTKWRERVLRRHIRQDTSGSVPPQPGGRQHRAAHPLTELRSLHGPAVLLLLAGSVPSCPSDTPADIRGDIPPVRAGAALRAEHPVSYCAASTVRFHVTRVSPPRQPSVTLDGSCLRFPINARHWEERLLNSSAEGGNEAAKGASGLAQPRITPCYEPKHRTCLSRRR